MTTFNSIIAAIDTRLDAHPIVQEAARIAKFNEASLKLVDVVPEFPWIARLMVREHANLREMTGREMQGQLDALAESFQGRGIDVETKVLWGKTSVEIIREVLRGRHDAVLAVAKGKSSRQKGFFGTTARRLLRDCPCAVWLVADADSPDYNHVMACIDTLTDHEVDAQLNARIYELASKVKVAMPLDDETLTAQEALDIAAFVNGHKRPIFVLAEHLPKTSRLVSTMGNNEVQHAGSPPYTLNVVASI